MRLWFDGEPDRFARTLALMPKVQTARTLYAQADPYKFSHSRLKAMAERIVAKLVRAA